jgi:hypothetical protein
MRRFDSSRGSAGMEDPHDGFLGHHCGVRHLTEQQALAALRRGAAIEQMLSEDLRSGSFRWLDARRSDAGFELYVHETLDDGSDNFWDIYEFRSVDDDDEFGTGVIVGIYPAEALLLQSASELGARPDRWVNDGVIQDEYGELRTRS